jgi:hypothetical protein
VNPFPVGPDASETDLRRASAYSKAMAKASRKGMKQTRFSTTDKLKVCLYMRRNTNCKRHLVGLKVLQREVPQPTVSTWYSQFQNHPPNKTAWDGPDEGLVWPTKQLGRPLSLPKSVVEKVQFYFDFYNQQGLQITALVTRYISYDHRP